MSKILKVRNVNDYASYVGCKEQHPLVSVINYVEVSPVRHSLNDYDVYGIFFHVPPRPAARLPAGKAHQGIFLLRLPHQRSPAHDRRGARHPRLPDAPDA